MGTKRQDLLRRLSTWAAGLGWGLLVLAAVVLVSFKMGYYRAPPFLLATLFLGAMGCLGGRALLVLLLSLRRLRPLGSGLAEVTLLGGILLALAAGTANWMLGLQGAVVLMEGEEVRLQGGTRLQAFDAGPFARLEELVYSMGLDELELISEGASGFYPLSRIRVWKQHSEPERLDVTPRESANVASLRFHQGAFGFAPRIVILEGEREVFDQVVPFLTRLQSTASLSFEGEFTIEAETMEVSGRVDLATLDEVMRGHASLDLIVIKDGVRLGQGSLLPGEFAELGAGYRVGFAGLDRWSEIDISRQNYSRQMYAGALVSTAGILLWLVAAWRGW
jgi:hypothetical protein